MSGGSPSEVWAMEVCWTDCGRTSSARKFLGCLKDVLRLSGLGSGGAFSERPSLTTPLNIAAPPRHLLPPCVLLHPYYSDIITCMFYFRLWLLTFPIPSLECSLQRGGSFCLAGFLFPVLPLEQCQAY